MDDTYNEVSYSSRKERKAVELEKIKKNFIIYTSISVIIGIVLFTILGFVLHLSAGAFIMLLLAPTLVALVTNAISYKSAFKENENKNESENNTEII